MATQQKITYTKQKSGSEKPLLSLSLEESNLHSQNQNLVHYHYAKGQSFPIDFGTAKIYIICKRAKLFLKKSFVYHFEKCVQ